MKRTSIYYILFFVFVLSYTAGMAQNTWIDKDIKKLVTGIQVGYVNQGGRMLLDGKENFYYDRVWESNYDRKVSGFCIGFPFQHSFGTSGFAFLWGITSEFYFSSNDRAIVTDATLYEDKYTNYFEWGLTIPLHLQFTLPLFDSRKWVLGFHTGPSYSFTIMGKYTDSRGFNADYDYFDHGSMEFFLSNNRNSLYYDLGFMLQFAFVRFDAVWSHGLSSIEETEFYNIYRNRFMAGLTFFFGY